MSDDSFSMPWRFGGAVILLVGGFLGALVSTTGLVGRLPDVDPDAQQPQLVLAVAAAVAAFVGGTQLAARSPPPGMWIGLFFMVPIPAVVAFLLGRLGRHLRTAPSAGVVRAVLGRVR